jgi:translation initiation factor 5A
MASKFSRTATKHFTRPVQANTLRLGDVILLQGGHPCKIVEMKESKTGKHGGMKIHFIGLDIFTLKKCTGLIQSQSNVTLAEVRKDEMMLIDISDDDFMSVLDGEETRADLKLPEDELGEKIRAAFDEGKTVYVTVLAAVGKEQVTGFRIEK